VSLKFSRIWRLDFNVLRLPILWVIFFYNSAAYAIPETVPPPLPKTQVKDDLSSAETAISQPTDRVSNLHLPAVETIDAFANSPVGVSANIDRHIADEASLTEARLLLLPTPLNPLEQWGAITQVAPPEMMSQPETTSPEVEASPSETDHSGTDSPGASDPELGTLLLREQKLQPAETTATDSAADDPELGILRLRERELEQLEPNSAADDSELGVLRLRERELEQLEQFEAQPDSPPSVFFIGRLNYFKSDNILLDRLAPIDDELLSLSATLLAVPSLGPDTLLITSVEGGLIHYNELSQLDYRELEFRASIRQLLSARSYGELGWSNQQLFSEGDRFFNDHSLRLTLARRDPLADRLRLDSFYQLRLSFPDPSDRSRVINTLGVGLNYDVLRELQVGLDYQLTLTNFIQQDREDLYSQIVAQLSYNLSRNSSIILFGGFSFGDSSSSTLDFNSSIFGVSIDVSVPVF
jgi:hypothetical protein